MPGGRTAHSRFDIPLNPTETSICGTKNQGAKAELPLAKKFAIESVDRTLQDIISSKEPFGGKIVVFGGNFRQVLPVVPQATREQIVNQSLVKSYLWPKVEVLRLKSNMRERED